MPSEAEKLGRTLRRSWMHSPECVRFLDEIRIQRQNDLVVGKAAGPSERRNDQGPMSFSQLVGLASAGCSDGVVSCASYLAVTIACALVSELLATLFNEERRAGGVFEVTPDQLDPVRHEKQLSLLALRNAVCHPGYLPAPVNDRSNIDHLAEFVGYEIPALQDDLRQDRTQVTGVRLARWAVRRTDDLGRFEIGRALVRELEDRGHSVTKPQAREIEKKAKDWNVLPKLIDRMPTASSAAELLSVS